MKHSVRSLGYVGLNVSNAAAWNELLTSVFALERRADAKDGVQQYKMDRWSHRMSLYADEADSIAYVGWEAQDAHAIAALTEQLEAASVEVTELTEAQCAERSVLSGIAFRDPVMNIPNEVFCGATIESQQFSPPRPMQGYVTGEHGMGHVVLMTTKQQEAVDFYCDVLGFEVSDIMDFGGEQWGGDFRHVFLHCNSRHHSLAIMSPPAGGDDGTLNHLALTVKSFDDLGYAYDIVREKQIPVLMTLGRHVNDLATSFYVGNPSHSAIEMTHGGIEVGDNWVIKRYDDTKIWGHHVSLPPKPLP